MSSLWGINFCHSQTYTKESIYLSTNPNSCWPNFRYANYKYS